MKLLPDIYYRFLMGELFSSKRANKAYDSVLSECIKSGIKSFRDGEYEGEVLFNNNIYYKFWNNNKYYAWLNSGKFTNNSLPTPNIEFNNTRPSFRTMYEFKECLENFMINSLSGLKPKKGRIRKIKEKPKRKSKFEWISNVSPK